MRRTLCQVGKFVWPTRFRFAESWLIRTTSRGNDAECDPYHNGPSAMRNVHVVLKRRELR